eukprot:13338799-Alexandrium_andersonii.AAC.1
MQKRHVKGSLENAPLGEVFAFLHGVGQAEGPSSLEELATAFAQQVALAAFLRCMVLGRGCAACVARVGRGMLRCSATLFPQLVDIE